MKVGVSIPREMIEEIRAAVRSRGHDGNLSWFATEAFEAQLARYRKLYNRGKPFPVPPGGARLKTGRPMKPTL